MVVVICLTVSNGLNYRLHFAALNADIEQVANHLQRTALYKLSLGH